MKTTKTKTVKQAKPDHSILPIKTVTYQEINGGDLFNFILHHTKKDYNIAVGESLHNGSYYHITVTGAIDPYYQERYNEWLQETGHNTDEGCFLLETILNVLCQQNKFPTGKYTIDASW